MMRLTSIVVPQLDRCDLGCLQPKMVYELTAVILNQIVSGRKSVLEAYGEIVFKAWRAATGACLERIETHLIQNVSMHSCLATTPHKSSLGCTFQSFCIACTPVPAASHLHCSSNVCQGKAEMPSNTAGAKPVDASVTLQLETVELLTFCRPKP